MSAPYSYEQINAHVSPVTPSVMHTKGNSLSYYFRKYLFLEAVSMVRWTLPDTLAPVTACNILCSVPAVLRCSKLTVTA